MKVKSLLRPGQVNLPASVWWLMAVYTLASLAHFAHNAEYIAFYPNMPTWITRATVYQAWLAVAGVGITGAALVLVGWPVAGAIFIAAYGGLGLDGLTHYTLALCSAHTLTANLTIWAEAGFGMVLFLAAGRVALKLSASKRIVRDVA